MQSDGRGISTHRRHILFLTASSEILQGHTLKAFMHQKPLTFMHYIHKDENFTHGVLTAIEGRLVHEIRGNIGRKLHCSATNTATTAGSHHSDGVQFNLSGQHDATSFPQTLYFNLCHLYANKKHALLLFNIK